MYFKDSANSNFASWIEDLEQEKSGKKMMLLKKIVLVEILREINSS